MSERPRHAQSGVSPFAARQRVWGALAMVQVTCPARHACLQGILHQYRCRSDCRSSRRSYTRRSQHHSSRRKRSQGRRSRRHSCRRSLRRRLVRRCGQRSYTELAWGDMEGYQRLETRSKRRLHERTGLRGTYQWSQLHPELRRRGTRAPFVVSDSPTNPLTAGSSTAR